MKLAARAFVLAIVAPSLIAATAYGQSDEERAQTPAASNGGQGDSEPEASAELPSGLVTSEWREPAVPMDPVWNLLLLPERLIEVMFSPVAGLVSLAETYRLDKRVVDALSNEAGTFKITPKFKFGGVDGLGLGANMTFKEFLGGDERWDLGGLYRTNGDTDLKTRYIQSFARLEGRFVELDMEFERDSNEPYYGIGGDTLKDDRRALAVERTGGTAAIDLNALGSLFLTGKLLVGFVRQKLSPGTDPLRTPVGAEGDSVEAPPGFEEILNFPSLGFEVRLDNRDRGGRPTRGTVARFSGTLTAEVGDSDQNAFTGELTVGQVIQLLPRHRILLLTAGVGVATPLENDAQVPIQSYITLGRDRFLRGYTRDRFRGKYGWWASAQYQFPVAEYMNTDVALQMALFLDTGRIADDASGLFDASIRYSYGVGFGVAHTSKSLFSVTIGNSPEGLQFLISGGLEL